MADVSRETSRSTGVVEAEPTAAARLFGGGIEQARAYAADLAEHSDTLGLLGPGELERLWTRHLLNCVLVAPLLGGGRVADVGSGAGLPGLVLAIARPDTQLVLIEPMERRADWLRDEAERLALDNVVVQRDRAEDSPGQHAFDQVTARAVANLSKLIPLCAGLTRPGGELLLMKGARVDEELDRAAKAVRAWRLRDARVEELSDPEVADATRVFRATVDAVPRTGV